MTELLHTEFLNDQLIEKIKELHEIVYKLCDESINDHEYSDLKKAKIQKVIADNLLQDIFNDSDEMMKSIDDEIDQYYVPNNSGECFCHCPTCEKCEDK